MRDLERVYIRDDRDGLVHARYRANVGPLHSPVECRVVGSDDAYRAEQDPDPDAA